jgi:5-methylcytosine-specific restriction endonuclease McrA
MQGKLQVRGLDPKQPYEWQVVLETDDPSELDRHAERYRAECGAVNVRLEAILARGEKAKLTRSVLERDKHQCRKCGKTVDVQVVSLRHQEYHNPDKLVTLCRVCRHARKIVLENPYDETATREWLNNGRTGLEEMVDAFRQEYPDAYAEIMRRAGVEGAADALAEEILLVYFGGNPRVGKQWSPHLVNALKEHQQRDPIPDAFRETDESSE